ncbi:MAG: hypothetical protein IPH45_17495, partial [Bacteroidales bacterium]|nr:hypothetical protein [Bacteroidales bacterium]
MKTYIQNGGTLILTLDALRLLPLLGLEVEEPATKKVSIRDEGYGRKAGLHSYREHPVFDSLFGGSYIFTPDKDMDTRQMGWFGNNLPSGKTIAVDWAYINLREDSKLLVEYTLGAGKVLVIGAYTWFNQENLNQRQLRLFFRNCIHYLVGASKSPANFWNYEPASVIKLPGFQDTALIFDAESWKENTHLMTLRRKYPQNQPFELAGESVLLMGKENGGIDEIWAHPFMALRDYEAGIMFEGNDSILWLNSQQPEIEVRPESYTRTYRFRRSYLKEIISCHPTEATSVVHYEFHSINAARIVIKMKTNLRFMWPYSEKVSGSLCYQWHPGLQALLVRNQKDEFAITVGANRSPIQQLAGRFDDFNKVVYPPDLDRMIRADSVFLGVPTEKMQVASLMLFNLQPNDQMDLVITASAKGQKDAIDTYRRAIPKPQWVQLSALRYTSGLFDKKTMLTSPDDTFNEGY